MIKRFEFSFIGATLFCAAWVFLGTILNTNGLENYGAATFITTPLFAGVISTCILNFKSSLSMRKSLASGALTILISYLLLLILAFEGILCLLMSSPIALAIQMMGTSITWLIIKRIRRPKTMMCAAFILLPLHSIIEPYLPATIETHNPSTELIIEARPSEIWEAITGINNYDQPDNWMMRAGVAHPRQTELVRKKNGQLVLQCQYSQGEIELLIDSLKPCELIRFTLAETPAPMKELSFHSHIHAPHLHGNFTVLYGQIELEPISETQTRLIASSAYTHHIKPAHYWKWWSDFFFNQVHQQVLQHIKTKSEQ